MSERRYTTIDKSGWPRGPWDAEPDKIQWKDDATGLACLIVRGPSGALCGYVGVPAAHPAHEVDYDQVKPATLDQDDYGYIEVHGGLTYADHCQHGDDESQHVCHVPEPGEPDDVWWLGFDCAHSGDVCPAYAGFTSAFREPRASYRDEAYVRNEVRCLARQLAELVAA